MTRHDISFLLHSRLKSSDQSSAWPCGICGAEVKEKVALVKQVTSDMVPDWQVAEFLEMCQEDIEAVLTIPDSAILLSDYCLWSQTINVCLEWCTQRSKPFSPKARKTQNIRTYELVLLLCSSLIHTFSAPFV